MVFTENKLILPHSLFRYAVILSHGLCHVSTGGMVQQLNKVFTTYGFTNYSQNFYKNCITCLKNNPQGNMRPKAISAHVHGFYRDDQM